MKVTGLTAAAMRRIADKLPIGGHISGDDLILVTSDGTLIDVGSVRGPAGPKGDTGGDITGVKQLLSPTGIISPYAGATAPTGWLICDGTSYLRTTYPDLFAVIGTAYGSVDSTHFNVPDFRLAVPVGKTASGTASVRGAKGGSKDAVVVNHGHKHRHSVSADGDHVHGIEGDAGNRIIVTYPQPTTWFLSGDARTTGGNAAQGVVLRPMDAAGEHDHGGSTADDSTAVGVSGVDANLPPYQVVNYIIRYGT